MANTITHGARGKHRIGTYSVDRRPATVGPVRRDTGTWSHPSPVGYSRGEAAHDN